MENYREFQGKDLDECIERATEYYGGPRENLEIEIVQDAKSGIFGIVGARKAKIRARRAHVLDAVADILQRDARRSEQRSRKETAEAAPPVKNEELPPLAAKPETELKAENDLEEDAKEIIREECEEKEAANCPERPWEELDHQLLEQKLREVIKELVGSIAGKDVPVRVDLSKCRPRAVIDWKGDAGLLIGREGQTLIALQYLASRILSHAMGATLRVQLDIGHYRLRQDDNLREMAKSMAKKVRLSGKPLSTKPLSSYHRRVIHVCLQPDPDVQTKSIGDGPLKRVLISPKRVCPQL